MSAPRLLIDLEKLHHNALTLVQRLALHGISVTGVTKAALGAPEIGNVLLQAGVTALAGSRIENLEVMKRAGVPGQMTLIRSPMLSQVDRVVRHADVSFNTELDVISALSSAAQQAGRMHGVILMVELGDLREGIMPRDLKETVRQARRFPNIGIKGIGTNLACRSGVSPDANNMAELSILADSIESSLGIEIDIVSGGNSANLQWALSGADTGRINNLRLGESILLGREPLQRQPIEGLHTDAITLVAEVIESKLKPSLPWGETAQTAFGEKLPTIDRGNIWQTILAIGHQDTDPCGLLPPEGIKILGASSDHLIVDSSSYHERLSVGSEVTF
ncbi:MAG: alanine/ornithine racemase family PLP-dependent enzyme, partial [Verrucomicrobiaceae bacterium]|nr:alanine/ornithine racemase family PLP-dependent enzyme [Verrucomicrobiaceae bacterium]